MNEREKNEKRVNDVINYGEHVVNKKLVPDQCLDDISEKVEVYRFRWKEQVNFAFDVRIMTDVDDLDKKLLEYVTYCPCLFYVFVSFLYRLPPFRVGLPRIFRFYSYIFMYSLFLWLPPLSNCSGLN